MSLMGDSLATLGSRLCLIFDPYKTRVLYPRFGKFDEMELDLALGIRIAKQRRVLPFTARYKRFSFIDQSITMNRIRFECYEPAFGIKFTATFTSPFYPRDVRLSTAPFFYIDFLVERIEKYRWEDMPATSKNINGEIFLELHSEKITIDNHKRGITFQFQTSSGFYNPELKDRKRLKREFSQTDHIFSEDTRALSHKKGITLPFTFQRSFHTTFVWAGYYNKDFFSIFGKTYPFKYTDFFKTPQSVMDFALKNKRKIMKKCDFFDQLFLNNSLSSDQKNFIAFSFHSFLMNTWYLKWKKGEDWFSVWEGSCYYHSTLDVEYNMALFHLVLWPQLLEMILRKWKYFERDGQECLGQRGKGSSFLSHDMGSGLEIEQQHYPHNMEIEENCNFLLLLFAFWRFTGSFKIPRENYELVKKLTRFIILSDLDGDGLPEKGVANTIDDASPAIQYGLKQTYLGLKSNAALECVVKMAGFLKDEEFVKNVQKHNNNTLTTLEQKAWLKDHFIVSLSRTTQGMMDAWTKKPLGKKELCGWDAYSIYTSNGLLYPLLAGLCPKIDREKIKKDLWNAHLKTRTQYGDIHTSKGDKNIWFSQNLFRDLVALYFDLDFTQHISSYWSYQQNVNTDNAICCYYDTTLQNNLIWYPRGITSMGIFLAVCRMALDRVKGFCHLDPIKPLMNIPLLPFVDWTKRIAPFVTTDEDNNVMITHTDLLKGLRIIMRGKK
ncbi:MAG: DUF4965 domain-containing protein [Spirochaetes bacterium]|nr:DUF4965 domain-containing protein [Spirochaetota bacterium]